MRTDKLDVVSHDEIARELRRRGGRFKSRAEYARSLEIYPSFLTAVISGHRRLGSKLLDELGLEERVVYVPRQD